MAEVNDLLKHGTWQTIPATSLSTPPQKRQLPAEAVMSLFHKVEAPAPPIDTSSQASVEEGEASLESNPINVSPTSSCLQQLQQ